MHYGERFALEGLLQSLRPRLSIEIGRAEGGSLRRIAAHSETVHSFDLVEEPRELREELTNVEFHTGDSASQVPEALERLSSEGAHVDFALVDGDHSSEGVRKDAEALLAADCCRTTAIVFHDAANDDVRAGLEAVGFETHPKVAMVMLDFVPGFLVENGPYRGHIWNGLGLVVLGDGGGPPVTERDRFDAAMIARTARDVIFERSRPDDAAESVGPAPSGASRRRFAAVALGALVAGYAAGALRARGDG
jgi:hypothetical protein